MTYQIKVNGQDRVVDVDGDIPLLWVLRDVLGMTGTKFGCGIGQCGACTVHLDGQPTRSCLTAIDSVGGTAITTIEAIGQTLRQSHSESMDRPGRAAMRLLPIWANHVRRGPARSNANPNDSDIDSAMSGNICRCGTYPRIRAAIKQAAQFSARSAKKSRPMLSEPRNLAAKAASHEPAAQSEGNLSRRTFLRTSAAVGGGLLLALTLPGPARFAEAAETSSAEDFAPNAFVRIGRDGRVYVDRMPGRDGPRHLYVDADAHRRGTGG